MAELIDEFMFVRRPQQVRKGEIAQSTYKEECKKVKNLRNSFGQMLPGEIEKVDIYEYIDWRTENGAPIGVNREIALLGRILQHGERLGLIKQSPCVNIQRNRETERTRYITDAEYQQFREFVAPRNPLVSAYMDFKYVSGMRNGDILQLTKGKLSEDGIDCYISKNKQHRIMEWSPTLRLVTKNLIASNWKPKDPKKAVPSSVYLMHNRKGQPYTGDGWRAIFYRLMRQACKEGVLSEPFCDHDIRAKAGSDAKSVEEAAKFLVHLNIRVTQKHYRRKPEYIEPLL